MIMQVHDELVFDVFEKRGNCKKIVKENMRNAIKMSIPVEVERSVGESGWKPIKHKNKLKVMFVWNVL